jgi:homoserine dehydrogenase
VSAIAQSVEHRVLGHSGKTWDSRGQQVALVSHVPCCLQAGKGSVELRRYSATHPFAQLQGSDNIIAFTTARYTKQPLIVRGPGAGADVTAGGVFSDVLKLAAYLGAPS